MSSTVIWWDETGRMVFLLDTHTHTHTYWHTHKHTHIHTNKHMHPHIITHMHALTQTCTHSTHTHLYDVYTSMHVYMHIAHTHTPTTIHTHVCMHMYVWHACMFTCMQHALGAKGAHTKTLTPSLTHSLIDVLTDRLVCWIDSLLTN